MANYYGYFGFLYHLRGDLNKAEETFRQALEIHERQGIQKGMAYGYGSLGIVAQSRGDLKTAREMWTKSLELYRRIGMPHMVSEVQERLDGLPNPPPPSDPKQ
jgi:tetratricopeptide (TPR) repeat protein